MKANRALEDAFDSMLRADYISLGDTEKLQLLGEYYVDYFNYLSSILSQTDQLIVGRRGTGKTTLMYRALVECMRSWDRKKDSLARARTLGIYIDLSKCQLIYEKEPDNSMEFEHIFVTEICEAIENEITRSWPDVKNEPGIFTKMFNSAETKKIIDVQQQLQKLSEILKRGVPRLAVQHGPMHKKDKSEKFYSNGNKLGASLKADLFNSPNVTGSLGGEINSQKSFTTSEETEYNIEVAYRLTVQDIIKILDELRILAQISSVFIFIDEFSSLSESLQRRFTTLLRKILGNHAGIYLKLGAITDNYTLGSSIILQRDLFEVSMDLDTYIARSASLQDAMLGLESQVKQIVDERLKAYAGLSADQVFEDHEYAWTELSRSAMGVPRTLGIILNQAYHRPITDGKTKIRKTDVEFGIKYASAAYEKQLQGAAKDGAAVPSYVEDIFNAIIFRASQEAIKSDMGQASHFMVRPENEEKIKYLNMFFVVHLLTRGRTTKKEKLGRSLYCIDYGICLEHNLGFAEHKNVIRQQRFAYDDLLVPFEKYFQHREEDSFRCPFCGNVYTEKELRVGKSLLRFCPEDKTDLLKEGSSYSKSNYTEEEIKIIGAIRSAKKADKLIASKIAEDVGCYVQKVAKFAEKLERERLIVREKDIESKVLIYYGDK